jgi:hypothetical protein
MAIKTKTTTVFAFDENDKKQIINNLERLKKMFLAKDCSKLADEMEEFYEDVDFATFAMKLDIPFINEINDNLGDDYDLDDLYSLFIEEVFPWIAKLQTPSVAKYTYEDFESYASIHDMSDVKAEALDYFNGSISIGSIFSWIVHEGSEKFGTALRDEFVNWLVNK